MKYEWKKQEKNLYLPEEQPTGKFIFQMLEKLKNPN